MIKRERPDGKQKSFDEAKQMIFQLPAQRDVTFHQIVRILLEIFSTFISITTAQTTGIGFTTTAAFRRTRLRSLWDELECRLPIRPQEKPNKPSSSKTKQRKVPARDDRAVHYNCGLGMIFADSSALEWHREVPPPALSLFASRFGIALVIIMPPPSRDCDSQ